ncbi:MAG: ABC transporter substrate-binding protein [Bacilli bacterium]|jgi:spermidine/putrescine-binding protein|nr:ABC transporter substrate-binding protein [Acholeplasmataceae bacterium]
MRKKIFSFVLLLGLGLIFSACSRKPTLYILNWGDYIDESLFAEFEKEFDCKVDIAYADSNERMYAKIKSRQVAFDIVIPSDYMVEKLYKEGLLNEIDFSKLENFHEGIFFDDLEEYRDGYFENNQKYAIPYFWGTLGIMYRTNDSQLETAIKTHGWSIFFNPSLLPAGKKIGMYDNPRDAVAVAELYLGKSLNTTNAADLQEVENTLKAQKQAFSSLMWGTDNLRTEISAGNLDVAVVYSGDFFDQYYIADEEGLPKNFNLFVPNYTNIWFDAMVIPTTSKQTDLAHKFIDYFLRTDVATQNADTVGYCPTHVAAYNALLEDETWAELSANYPFYPIPDSENFHGEIYKDLGNDIYNRFASILDNAKA